MLYLVCELKIMIPLMFIMHAVIVCDEAVTMVLCYCCLMVRGKSGNIILKWLYSWHSIFNNCYFNNIITNTLFYCFSCHEFIDYILFKYLSCCCMHCSLIPSRRLLINTVNVLTAKWCKLNSIWSGYNWILSTSKL